MNILSALISPIAGVVTSHLKNKAEEAQAKHQAKLSVIQNDANWEQTMADATKDSWKDELWTIFFVALLSACFYPPAQPYIEDGFRFLREDLPEWLSWSIMASIAASFGLKSIGRIKG